MGGVDIRKKRIAPPIITCIGKGVCGRVGRVKTNISIQISRQKKLPKISVSLLQPKSCKNDAHDETFSCKKEGEGSE